MKVANIVLLAGVAVGGYLLWKNRAKLIARIAPDPTVQTIAGSTYGGAQDVNGNIGAALGGLATSALSNYFSPPADNSALTDDSGIGDGSETDYAGMFA